jgi:ubiquinone/menaquinone biosynthesis C-methylase UbiE
MSAQTHTSDPRILGRRTLERDHRRLAALLRPGMHVLDVGCGTGAITAGIARAVGEAGPTVGIDRDAALLALARESHGGIPGLHFEERDVLALEASGAFDVANAARVLQWIDRPGDALARMKAAVRPGGLVVALDYSHARLAWEPTPPRAVTRFHEAFLAWRAAHGWDNLMADHLASLFEEAGLADVTVSVEDEIAAAGDAGFGLWHAVIEGIGHAVVQAGALAEEERAAALVNYDAWCASDARRLALVLRAVVGHVR